MRGVWRLVGALLLVVTSVVGSFLVYFWFSGYLVRGASQVGALPSVLKIEAAELISDPASRGLPTGPPGVPYAYVFLYIRNLGSEEVVIDTVYLYVAGSQTPACWAKELTFWRVPPGGVLYLNGWLYDCSVRPGAEYVVKVVAINGVETSAYVVAR